MKLESQINCTPLIDEAVSFRITTALSVAPLNVNPTIVNSAFPPLTSRNDPPLLDERMHAPRLTHDIDTAE